AKGEMARRLGEGIAHRLTAQGWAALSPSSAAGIPGTCFVAMSFDPELMPIYTDGIKPAIDDCGFSVTRVDRVEHNDNINDRIIADIRSCQFMVADFTQHKAGVYFEAGYALGLGRNVIWTCGETDFKRAHFDTRSYNHIVYNSTAHLR